MSNSPHDGIARLRRNKKPSSQRVGIVMDSRYQNAIDDAQYRLAQLQMRARVLGGTQTDRQLANDLADAQEALENAQAAALEHTEWFIAKALSPRQYDALLAKHPPTKDQKAEARKDNRVVAYNIDTFPPELIASCVYLVTPLDEPDPETGDMERHEPLTEEFVKEMFEGGDEPQWNQGELVALTNAAQAANQAQPQRVAALGNG